MIGTQVGPFRLLSELGSGGMGTVYLAETVAEVPGVEVGAKAAVKVIHPHLLATPGFFKRFLREAEVGKQVQHENVVRTLDVDATLHEGKQVNYMVLEYVEGRSLRNVLLELGTVPEALLREIARQIAAGLSAIHQHGIIHRDLKPENVLITDDHRVRIMDLGVAKLQEASVAITKEGQFAGSFLYAAPEQFRGLEVGPKADLYSMGVMLFEMATGQNPFRREDAGAVIHAHLEDVPPRASELSGDTSEFAAELIHELLAKDAERRLGPAEAVHTLLREGESSVWWAERETRLRARERHLPSIEVRRETDVHGRDEELATLQGAWEKARKGEGSTLLIEGEAGIGKTRIVDAFLRSLVVEDFHVLYGAYPPSGGLGGLSDAILGKFGSANLESTLQPYVEASPALVPAFVALVKHESPPTGSEPLSGDALHAVCCNVMRSLAADRPTIWVVEDLNFAPEESRDLVLSMARAVGGHRVLLLVTARSGLPEEELAHLGRRENFRRIHLARLGAREVIEVLRDGFKSKALAEKLGGKIAYKSDGVPFFIFEMLRGLKEGSLIRRLPDGSYEQTQAITDIEVPSAVRDLLESRLRGITEEERNLLDVAAVLGFEFDPDLVARVCEMRRVTVLQKLAGLERGAGIVCASGTSYRFDHKQLREHVYGALSPGLRQEYHTLLAEAVAQRESVDAERAESAPGETANLLAWHHLLGSDPRCALPFMDRALSYLEEGHRKGKARELADLALSAPKLLEGAERAEMLLRKATNTPRPGQPELLNEAVEIAGRVSDSPLLARAHNRLGAAYMHLGKYEEAANHLNRGLEFSRKAGRTDLEPLVSLGSLSWYLGDYERAREHYSAALEQAAKTDAEETMANATWGLGLVLWNLGRWGEAHDRLRALQELADRRADKMAALGASANLGPLLAALGDTAQARKELGIARQQSVAAANRANEAFAIDYLAAVAEQEGELQEARKLFGEALDLRREIEHRAGIVETLVGLGRLTLGQGSPEGARPYLEEARDLANEIGVPGMCSLACAHLSALPGADTRAIVKEFEAGENHLDARRKIEARYALWQATHDAAHLEEAHRILAEVRDHAPEESREAMIEMVPLHKAIMAEHEEQRR